MPSKQSHLCPVCGYAGLADPPRDSQGNPSWEICDCCGTEFGYDDASKNTAALRMNWLRNGAPWWSKTVKPPKNWNPVMQLRKAKLLDAVIAVRQTV